MNIGGNMKLLLYGCGTRGRYLLDFFKEVEYVEIIGITDKNDDAIYTLSEENVSYFKCRNEILKMKFDYLLVTSDKYFKDIFSELIAYGVEEHKIVSLKELNNILINVSIKEKRTLQKCNLCNNEVFDWLPTGDRNSLFEKKSVIGAGYRKGICTVCGSTDRLRYEYYVLKKYTNIFDNNSSILHFAPEDKLSEKFRKRECEYITADIKEGRADVVADITNLQFRNDYFDWIICNHVMEHIKNEYKAFNEIKRCLKPGGNLILSVPICWDDNTFERDDIVTEEDKALYYGQSDHERIYGRDIVERIEKYGFDVKAYKNTDICNEREIEENRFIVGDTVFICTKKYGGELSDKGISYYASSKCS